MYLPLQKETFMRKEAKSELAMEKACCIDTGLARVKCKAAVMNTSLLS
jgi:hypothetical protein